MSMGHCLVLLEAHAHLKSSITIIGALDVLAGIDARGDLLHLVPHLGHLPQCGKQGVGIELSVGHVALLLHQALGVALEVLVSRGLHAASHEILQLRLCHLVFVHALFHQGMEVGAALQRGKEDRKETVNVAALSLVDYPMLPEQQPAGLAPPQQRIQLPSFCYQGIGNEL